MTLHQPAMVPHMLPWWLGLVGAAIIGAALLLGVLLIAGQTNVFQSTGTEPTSMHWMSPELQQFRQGQRNHLRLRGTI